MREITVFSPATVANVVCGIDILGFALNDPFDKLIIRKTSKKGVVIINKDDYSRYEWNLADKNGYVWFMNNDYKYMGKLEIPEDMKDQYKYNL